MVTRASGNRRLDQRLDLVRRHRHRAILLQVRQPSIQAGKKRSCAARKLATIWCRPSGSVKSFPPEVPIRIAGTPAASAARISAPASGTAST